MIYHSQVKVEKPQNKYTPYISWGILSIPHLVKVCSVRSAMDTNQMVTLTFIRFQTHSVLS